MAKQAQKTASKYTPEMEARIRATAPHNAETAAKLAVEFGEDFTTRSIIAKINRMNDVEYRTKQPVSKTGAPVEQKETIVAQIAELTGANLAGLEKAPKPVLQRLRDYLAA